MVSDRDSWYLNTGIRQKTVRGRFVVVIGYLLYWLHMISAKDLGNLKMHLQFIELTKKYHQKVVPA